EFEFGPSETSSTLIPASVPVRVSTRDRVPKSFGEDFVTYHLEDDPSSYKEAMRSRDSLLWAEAIDDEMSSLLQNHTWQLVDLPKG
ncbi:rve domain-containing protein/gag_pre-integrs domain-containing protein/UBN2_2 domain-containing protein, partial [Cephalotus follicularis]